MMSIFKKKRKFYVSVCGKDASGAIVYASLLIKTRGKITADILSGVESSARRGMSISHVIILYMQELAK